MQILHMKSKILIGLNWQNYWLLKINQLCRIFEKILEESLGLFSVHNIAITKHQLALQTIRKGIIAIYFIKDTPTHLKIPVNLQICKLDTA